MSHDRNGEDAEVYIPAEVSSGTMAVSGVPRYCSMNSTSKVDEKQAHYFFI